jgi:hypothetical protein
MAPHDDHRYRERLLEELYSVFGDMGAQGRSADYLSRVLCLPLDAVNEIAASFVVDGFVKRVATQDGIGYVLTYSGARYFATKVLGVSGVLEKTLSADAIETLVSHLWSHARGPVLKTILGAAFRTDRYPVFKRATEYRLRQVIVDHNQPFRSAYLARLANEFVLRLKSSPDRDSQNDLANLSRVLRRDGFLDTNREPGSDPSDVEDAGRSSGLSKLEARLRELTRSPDRAKRGYDFEELLVSMFDMFGLAPRRPYRVTGGQFDGAFELDGRHFLLEAKWTQQPASHKELSFFVTKVSQQSLGPHGLFVSMSGFSSETVRVWEARGGCPVMLADGSDIVLVLEGRIDLRQLLRAKIRAASQEGRILLHASTLVAGA